MSIAKLNSALKQGFVDAEFFDEAKVQWENMPFTPPKDTPWAAMYFIPNQPGVATLGAGGEDAVDGLVQIDLNYPVASGTKAIEAKVEAVRNVFQAGHYFTYEGESAVIRSCGRSPGRVVNNCYRISVSIVFYARTNRS